MKKILLLLMGAFLTFTLSAQVSENFSDYTVGGKIAQQAQAMGRDYWTTWSNAPGGPEDGKIAEISGNKVGHFTYGNDQILLLGNKTSGIWIFSCKVNVPAAKRGYINLLADFAGTESIWALEVYFNKNGTASGTGSINAGGQNAATFPFTHDAWTNVSVTIDLDNDVAKLDVNGTMVKQWTYSLGADGTGAPRVIAVFDMYPPDALANSEFYVDDIVFKKAPLYETGFDDKPSGSYVAQSYPNWWTTWENSPGTAEDALITNEQSSSPNNSAKCTFASSGGTDLVFKAGNQTSGTYFIDFDMYIPTSGRAFFNLLHIFNGSGSEWAVGVYFNVSATGMPPGTNIQQNGALTPFTFPFATWFPVSIIVDLDNDQAKMKINNVELLTWQFSLTENAGPGLRQLAAVDFYPPQAGSVFYIDNFVFDKAGEATAPIIGVTPSFITEVITPGENLTKTITVANTGTSMGEYSSWIKYEFEPTTGTQTFTLSNSNEPNANGLGYPDACTLELATKFTGDELCGKIGTSINKLSYYLAAAVGSSNKLTFRIYGPNNTNLPGEKLREVVLNNAVVGTWNIVTLTDPLLIDLSELWISVEFYQNAATYPIGVDNGPQKLGYNFTKRNGGAWTGFTQTEFGNFLVTATAQGGVVPGCWFKLSGDSNGNVPLGSSKTFNANFNTAGLADGLYKAKLNVKTNDATNPIFIIPVDITVGTPPSFPIINVTPLEFSATIKEDADVLIVNNTVTINNTGTAEGSYTTTVEAQKPWLTIEGDATGTVAIDNTKTFDVVINATDLDTGIYNGKITVVTNDVEHPEFVIECTLTVEPGVGIITINGVETKIFPNPASDFVTVQCSEMINSIKIMNNMGQVVRTVFVNNIATHLDTSNLSAGVYFFKIITDKTTFSTKLIIK
ncbi:MAG: T9SS type A sorting domain-containing protein [Bacteroidales bacterium]|jgi:hypothetical protein|nr:T9SS type A sorting domain-containing protein [Bacteroidales bacterium]